MIERRGEAVKNLVIRGESHEVNRRATEPHLDSPISDNSLFQNTKNKVLRIRRDEEDEKLKAKGTSFHIYCVALRHMLETDTNWFAVQSQHMALLCWSEYYNVISVVFINIFLN